ncbi:MAG: SufD family Fe-S cluster assembly protein [Candidatus Gracilibacteria bacterium]|nr:SufD family Fe-S cluster assembly protein [Candidatus Gracilibacteria bacterium]
MTTNIINNNYISKSGLYIVDDNSPSVIDITNKSYVTFIMINTTKPFTFNLEEGTILDFYGFFNENCSNKILFNQLQPNSKLEVKTMYLTTKNDLSSNIKSYISTTNAKSNLEIVNIIKNNKLNIDSAIEIEENSKKIESYLNQTNIFIGDKGSVRGLPKLFVKTDDIKAGHSCKIHRINEDNLYYLNSRGLNKNDAVNILIESNFNNLFKCLNMLDKNVLKKLEEIFFENI